MCDKELVTTWKRLSRPNAAARSGDDYSRESQEHMCGAPVCSQSQLCSAQQSLKGHSKAVQLLVVGGPVRCNDTVLRPNHLLCNCFMHMLRCSCCQMRGGMDLQGAQRRSARLAMSWCTATVTEPRRHVGSGPLMSACQ